MNPVALPERLRKTPLQSINQSISHAFAAPCEQVSDPLTGQADGKMQRPPFTETLTEGVRLILRSIL